MMNETNEINKRLEQMSIQTDDDWFVDGSDENSTVELFKALKLSKQLKSDIKEISNISREEIKMLVKIYYQLQDNRKATREQIRSIEDQEGKETNVAILDWLLKNYVVMEKGIVDCLELVCMSNEVGRWLLNIKAIGPVLAAGLLAYLDVTDKQYATQFMSYAGLNDNNRPWLGADKSKKIVNEIVGESKVVTDDMVVEIAAKTQWKYEYLRDNAYDPEKKKWNKANIIKACSKVPYNKELKVLMYKVGASFQWRCNDAESVYGTLFSQRRVLETQKNENGDFAKQAAECMSKVGTGTVAYKSYKDGKLPKAHITARASRWTQKIFLSHLFEEMYRVKYDKVPPRYYSLEHCEGHHDEIEPEVPYTKVSSEK